jgi:cytochrome c peroxidase
MSNKRKWVSVFLVAVGLLALVTASAMANGSLTPQQELGKAIFFDKNLSINQNQSCASCHDPAAGWVGPDSEVNAGVAIYEGSIPGRFGNRKPPSAAYATLSPIFHMDKKGLFVGGNFWDGRATGEKLGNPAADQAQGPFLNPLEQGLPDSACVVYRVCTGSYGSSFEAVWGAEACDITWPADVETACAAEGTTVALSSEDREISDQNYDSIAITIAAYEDSPEVNAFTSKYDYTFDGKVKLSKEEQKGYALFQGKGKCKLCHLSGKDALFTDFTFDNLGIPKNPENPFYEADTTFNPDGYSWIDFGLGGFLASLGYDDYADESYGMHKVPTLRNVDLRPDPEFVKAFGHNGYFKSLEGIVHFYNTRDVLDTCPGDYTEAQALAADCWPAPEVAENVNTAELGDLGLTPEEEAALVAFLRTLSDGFEP